MSTLYAYVGPREIRERVRHQAPGAVIRAAGDLKAWIQAHAAPRSRELTATFVIDASGLLRVSGRHGEHVACAGGALVLSAGEVTFAASGRAVIAISNQSTGYCPEPGSWPAVQRALDALGLAHPGAFTSAFEFRRCPACAQINVVKDAVFLCDACDAELPVGWNFVG
jgi:hypothetical protein